MAASIALLGVAILGIIHGCAAGDGGKPISAVLDANRKSTPLLSELSEFVASRSNASFWTFVDSVSTIKAMNTDQEEYDGGLAVLKGQVNQLELDLLKNCLVCALLFTRSASLSAGCRRAS